MTPKRAHIRAVPASGDIGQESTPPKVLTLCEAVEKGDYLEILRAQRREIVATLPDERGPAKAALHRQLAMISKEIQALEAKAAQAADEDTASADDEEDWNAEAL